ncbi:hypothetical protein E4U21_006770 [Claviceps maximensis]|nr:hypothetical protein E4U21_006770 [Claviceps maximensis]
MQLPILALTTLVVGTLADKQSASTSSSAAVPTAPPLHSFPPIAGASRIPDGIVPTTTARPTTTETASSKTPTKTPALTSTSTAWAVPTGQARVGPVLGVVAALLALHMCC